MAFTKSYLSRVILDIEENIERISELDRQIDKKSIHLEVMDFEKELEEKLYGLWKESSMFFMKLSSKE